MISALLSQSQHDNPLQTVLLWIIPRICFFIFMDCGIVKYCASPSLTLHSTANNSEWSIVDKKWIKLTKSTLSSDMECTTFSPIWCSMSRYKFLLNSSTLLAVSHVVMLPVFLPITAALVVLWQQSSVLFWPLDTKRATWLQGTALSGRIHGQRWMDVVPFILHPFWSVAFHLCCRAPGVHLNSLPTCLRENSYPWVSRTQPRYRCVFEKATLIDLFLHGFHCADWDVCWLSFRKRIGFTFSPQLSAALLQSADCSLSSS